MGEPPAQEVLSGKNQPKRMPKSKTCGADTKVTLSQVYPRPLPVTATPCFSEVMKKISVTLTVPPHYPLIEQGLFSVVPC